MDGAGGRVARATAFAMTLLTLFAALAFGLAAIGTYGVLAYLVSQGTREIGIRMALGATPERVAGMIVRGGMMMAAIGIVVGIAGGAGADALHAEPAVRRRSRPIR